MYLGDLHRYSDANRPNSSVTAAVEDRVEGCDRLEWVRAHEDRLDAEGPRRGDVLGVVVEEQRGLGLDTDARARQLVDARVGFAHADLARVDDDREQVFERDARTPRAAELLDVVRQQREPYPAG